MITPTATPTCFSAEPMAARPTWASMGVSAQNQPMEELVHALVDGDAHTRCPGSPVSIGAVSMPPGHAARAHQHTSTWIYVVVLKAGRRGVVTRWGSQLEHEIVHSAGDILVMPPGIPHVAINLSRWRSVYAIELRVSASVHHDNDVLAHLQYLAELRRPRPLVWPARAATRLLHAVITATRRRAGRRTRAGTSSAGGPAEPAGAAADTPPATGQPTAPQAGTHAEPDTKPAEDASDTAERASRDGPARTARTSVHRGDGLFVDWSNSSPPPYPTGYEPVSAQSAPHSADRAGGGGEISVVVAAIDLLATTLDLLRPALDARRPAVVDPATRLGHTRDRGTGQTSTSDRPL